MCQDNLSYVARNCSCTCSALRDREERTEHTRLHPESSGPIRAGELLCWLNSLRYKYNLRLVAIDPDPPGRLNGLLTIHTPRIWCETEGIVCRTMSHNQRAREASSVARQDQMTFRIARR